MYICTCGAENPEKAHIPFVLANAALAMDIKATIALQGNGVYLGIKGYVEHMLPGGGFPPIAELMDNFFELGGEIMICEPCIKERNIDESDLIEGGKITAAVALNLAAIDADALFVY